MVSNEDAIEAFKASIKIEYEEEQKLRQENEGVEFTKEPFGHFCKRKRVERFKEFAITDKEFNKLKEQRVWTLTSAVLYLHKYQSTGRYHFDDKIIHQDKAMSETLNRIEAANERGEINTVEKPNSVLEKHLDSAELIQWAEREYLYYPALLCSQEPSKLIASFDDKKTDLRKTSTPKKPLKAVVPELYDKAMPIWEAYIEKYSIEPTRTITAKLLKQEHDLRWNEASIERELSATELQLKFKAYMSKG